MEKGIVRLKTANITDLGKNPSRTVNEDYLGHYEGEYGQLFLVCDGMGGHEAGEVASRLAVESIKQYFEANYLPGEELTTIAQSIDFAQQKIVEQVRQNPDLSSMGTTLVLLLIKGMNFWYAHSGDSRIYMSRGGTLNQLTNDHSEVQQMVDSGIITPEQAAGHPRRNYITKAVGHTNYLPEISGPHMLRQDDVFLLCTDGLTEYVKEDELLQEMEEEPQIACRNLVEMANDRGGSDNITIQIVQVLQGAHITLNPQVSTLQKKKLMPSLAIVLTVLVFLGAVFWFVLGQNNDSVKPPKKTNPEKKTAVSNEADLDALEKIVNDKLGAYNSGNQYDKYKSALDAFKGNDNKGLKLMFIQYPQNKQVVYILPGRCIYLAFSKIGIGSDAMIEENIKALIAIAVAKKTGSTGLTKENWEKQFFANAGKPVDDNLYATAQDICGKLNPDDPSYAKVMFSSDSRFGGVRPRIKVSAYNISLD